MAPHFAILPSAGMGHLSPLSRLAALLSLHGCHVTIIVAEPTVSSAESRLLSRLLSLFPQIRTLPFPFAHPPGVDRASDPDPFYLRYESLRRSSHLLSPLLSSSPSPPFSALIVDVGLASSFIPVASALRLPCYVFFAASAAILSFYSYFPTYISSSKDRENRDDDDVIGDVDVPGLWTVPRRSVIPFLHDKDDFMRKQLVENAVSFGAADGIVVNTCEGLEGEALKALNEGRVVRDLPPVMAIGPLQPIIGEKGGDGPVREWLDGQAERSVVYVSFGSRTAMTREQIRELADGLEKSQCRFLWVIKTKKVDREEESEMNLEGVLGEGYIERVKERALVRNGWVEQEEILSHRAIGLFLSHCGWNSVMEAAFFGVRVMAWPRGADQRVNGEVVRRSGLGVWMEDWSWEAEERIVSGDEIGKRVKEVMEDEEGKKLVERVRDESRRAMEFGGSSYKVLKEFIGKFQV